MIVSVRSLLRTLAKFDKDAVIEITSDEIIHVQSAHRVRKISESKVFTMAAQGIGSTEIAVKLGCSKQYVNWVLNKRERTGG